MSVDWAPRPLFYHGGSNGKNLAHIWVDVERDFAMVIVSNISTPLANEGFLSLAAALYDAFVGGTRGRSPR